MQHHVLLVTFPAQGHINPCLRFAERLLRIGIQVTLVTSDSVVNRLLKSKTELLISGLNFASFSDGHGEEGYKHGVTDPASYLVELKKGGLVGLRKIIKTSDEKGQPVTCLIYALFIPWVATLAREFHIPSAHLFIQPATVFNLYYRYFNGYEDEISRCRDDPNWTIQFPGLPAMKDRDLPSFFRLSESPALTSVHEHVQTLDAEEHPRVLINTFEGLEPEQVKAIKKYKMFPVGPFIPLSLCNGIIKSSDASVIGNISEESEDYLNWLNSQPESSVIYISFGSMLVLPKKQTEEIAKALLESGRPFLWVIRDDDKQEKLSCLDKLQELGKIVSWCSQLEVLMNPSLGCFVTHCGWNSTLESIICGIPVVAFPQWTDQTTNAKLLEDVWRIGVRVVSESEDGTVDSGEVQRCIEMVMGDNEGAEFRINASKLKDMARDAIKEGGCSDMNLKEFFQEITK